MAVESLAVIVAEPLQRPPLAAVARLAQEEAVAFLDLGQADRVEQPRPWDLLATWMPFPDLSVTPSTPICVKGDRLVLPLVSEPQAALPEAFLAFLHKPGAHEDLAAVQALRVAKDLAVLVAEADLASELALELQIE